MNDIKVITGQPFVLQGRSGRCRIVGGTPSRITLNHCPGIELSGEFGLQINGAGEGKQLPLIAILNSPNVVIDQPILSSQVDETTKETWKTTICNGIAICPKSSNAIINQAQLDHVHMGIINRAESLTVTGGKLSYWSGDSIHSTDDNNRIVDFDAEYALEVWPYPELHRDFMQFYQGNKAKVDGKHPVLTGLYIKNCRLYAPNHGHKWAKSCDGIMGTDHIYRDVSILNNQIYTDNQNGIFFNPIKGYRIEGNALKEARYGSKTTD